MEDNQILELYRERKESAISETERKYGNYAHYIACRILENDEDANECVNDTYIKIWNTIPPQNPQSLSSYVGMIARQTALNRFRANNRQKRGGGKLMLAFDEICECIPDESGEESDDSVIGNALNVFLAALPKKSQIVFMRRYWYFNTAAEIAADFGMSENSVNVLLFRTRNKLKKYLEKEGVYI